MEKVEWERAERNCARRCCCLHAEATMDCKTWTATIEAKGRSRQSTVHPQNAWPEDVTQWLCACSRLRPTSGGV